MGSTNSTMSSQNEVLSEVSETNGFVLRGYHLSPEVLTTVLSHVPSKILLCHCRLVCKNWKALIDDQTLWKIKCDRGAIPIPRVSLLETIPPHYYRHLALKNPYGRNLIQNPCGAEGMRYWHYTEGGDGWVVEKPPKGADDLSTLEELAGMQHCFATSYFPCAKHQVLDLIREGCEAFLLDDLQPHILIQDWYAARFDCACRYTLTVTLMDGRHQTITEFSTGSIDEVQWAGRSWHKVEHIFKDYGQGLRYIKFRQIGQDLQFWAGNYGSKMTASTVRILLP